MNRRLFAKTLTGAAFTAASYSRIYGANDRLGMALIGSGRRGTQVMKALIDSGAELRGICDIYDDHRTRASKYLAPTGDRPFECVGHEDMLARRDVDAVLIGTPDHLHLDLATDAFRAGKHVYLEKPSTHQLHEGAALLKEARQSGKICQIGTQQRSGPHYMQAREQYLQTGKLGKVVFVRTFWSDFPWQARKVNPAPKPAGLDWPRFLGHTPYYEWSMQRYDSWRLFPEYGGGVLADILNHWADVAQWLMDDHTPLNAVASGGVYELPDGRVNPDTVNAIVQYRNWNLSFESSVLTVKDERPAVVFAGTHGQLDIARTGFVYRPNQGQPVEVPYKDSLEHAHAADFLKAVKTGKKPNADVEIGLQGVLPCHLARAAYWSGKRAVYDAGRNEIVI